MWAVPETAAPDPGESVGSSVACIPATFMDASAAAKVPSGTKARSDAREEGAEWLALALSHYLYPQLQDVDFRTDGPGVHRAERHGNKDS